MMPSQCRLIPLLHLLLERIDVGGKLLTNQLKDIVSYRHYNMMDQTYIINDIKEQCCYVSQNFAADLDVCQLVSFFLPPGKGIEPLPL